MNFTGPLSRADDTKQEARFDHAPPGRQNVIQGVGETWIGDLIVAIRRRTVLLCLWLLFCVALGSGYTSLAQPEYIASAQIALEPRVRLPGGIDAATASSAVAPILDSAQADSQLQIIRSVKNLQYVFDTLNLMNDSPSDEKNAEERSRNKQRMAIREWLGISPKLSEQQRAVEAREIAFQRFYDRVQAKRLGQSYVIEVSYRGTKPEETARITNSIAAAYIRDQVLSHVVSEQRGSEFLQGRISLIQAEKKAADAAVASGEIANMDFPDSDARVVGQALRPLAPAYPQPKLNLLLAGIAGLVTGIAAIAIANHFDRNVRSPEQIRRVLGLECLVILPRLRPSLLSYTTVIDHPDTEFAKGVRHLRTALYPFREKSKQFSIGFVACQSGDGCSVVTSNFAQLIAGPNNPAVLVDADLQKPDLTRVLAPNVTIGLDRAIESLSEDVDLPEIRLANSLNFVPAVAAGLKANPNIFLGARLMHAVLSCRNRPRDYILDLPSLTTSSDAYAISDMLTGVVLVAAVNKTDIDKLTEAVRAIQLSNGRVLGIVLNDPVRSRLRRVPTGSHELVQG
ncbi:hypothetical protein FV228_02110 [Methylobacterium sp. WL18]|uniref:Wzz/FepE/Etk N-terminal domain-containing protein n=1 Tax=Methylobacterium sp. WL18 TaxID=2603897 RepID=UPI0011C76442|nr:Wzz/FepE/Etk N-terminal domain-containing protein [Methylobacterium sp. WL18]TXN75905.1 hypothetical protein FV228_02110 [Methylobacterium sp. WL18]